MATREISAENQCAVSAFLNSKWKYILSLWSDNLLQRARLIGAVVRLAFHDAGEVDIRRNDTLGADGCLTQTPSNYGLLEVDSPVFSIVEPLWQEICDKISRADFWVMFARKVIQENVVAGDYFNMMHYYGRPDNINCEAGEGRLPAAQGGITEITRVFMDQMGLTMEDVGTLIYGYKFVVTGCILYH